MRTQNWVENPNAHGCAGDAKVTTARMQEVERSRMHEPRTTESGLSLRHLTKYRRSILFAVFKYAPVAQWTMCRKHKCRERHDCMDAGGRAKQEARAEDAESD